MGKMSRTKGAAGERELAGILYDHLGFKLERNLSQTRDGGYDLTGIPPLAIEVKRYGKATDSHKNSWWCQALSQAGEKIPVLAYRLNNQKWVFVLRLSDLLGSEHDNRLTVEMGVEAFCFWCRESALEIPPGGSSVPNYD